MVAIHKHHRDHRSKGDDHHRRDEIIGWTVMALIIGLILLMMVLSMLGILPAGNGDFVYPIMMG